jgi:hypothetical protein
MSEDLARTKKAYQIAQKAFYEKDPESIALLQLEVSDSSDDKIYLFDGDEEQTLPTQTAH